MKKDIFNEINVDQQEKRVVSNGIDYTEIVSEYNLIKSKTSKLSAKKRKRIADRVEYLLAKRILVPSDFN